MTLIFAVLASYFLDPLVTGLERIRVPRAIGAFLALALSLSVVGALGYMAANGLDQFSNDWPRYSRAIRKITTDVDRRLERVESRVSEITPADNQSKQVVAVQERQRPVRDLLVSGIGSIYSVLFLITFVPFLVFFMLAGRNAIWRATLHLFPEGRRPGEERLRGFESCPPRLHRRQRVRRDHSCARELAVLLGHRPRESASRRAVVSGFLSMVPYLGAVLSWIPPMVIGLTTWHTLGPFLAVAGTLSALHLIGNNVLIPAIVGRRAHLNIIAVTIALLFWGWVWGAIGLVLAIPITATIKVVCDHVEGYQTIGAWLGSS